MDSSLAVKRTFLELESSNDWSELMEPMGRPRADTDTCIDYSYTELSSLPCKGKDDLHTRDTTIGSDRSSRWCDDEDDLMSLLSEDLQYDYIAPESEESAPSVPSAPSAPSSPPCMAPGMASAALVPRMPMQPVYVPMMIAMVPAAKEEEKEKPEKAKKEKKKKGKGKSQSTTTIVLRHLPTELDRDGVQQLLDTNFQGFYDFLYLPMDFNSSKNFGYVIVNFATTSQAEAARVHFDGAQLGEVAVSAEWSKSHSGLPSLVERYKSSPVMDPSMPDQFKPILLARGKRVAFPA